MRRLRTPLLVALVILLLGGSFMIGSAGPATAQVAPPIPYADGVCTSIETCTDEAVAVLVTTGSATVVGKILVAAAQLAGLLGWNDTPGLPWEDGEYGCSYQYDSTIGHAASKIIQDSYGECIDAVEAEAARQLQLEQAGSGTSEPPASMTDEQLAFFCGLIPTSPWCEALGTPPLDFYAPAGSIGTGVMVSGPGAADSYIASTPSGFQVGGGWSMVLSMKLAEQTTWGDWSEVMTWRGYDSWFGGVHADRVHVDVKVGGLEAPTGLPLYVCFRMAVYNAGPSFACQPFRGWEAHYAVGFVNNTSSVRVYVTSGTFSGFDTWPEGAFQATQPGAIGGGGYTQASSATVGDRRPMWGSNASVMTAATVQVFDGLQLPDSDLALRMAALPDVYWPPPYPYVDPTEDAPPAPTPDLEPDPVPDPDEDEDPVLPPAPAPAPNTPPSPSEGTDNILGDRIGGFFDNLGSLIGGAFDWLGDLFGKWIRWLAERIAALVQWLYEGLARLLNGIIGMLQWIGQLLGYLTSVIADAFAVLGEALLSMLNAIYGLLQSLLGMVIGLLSDVVSAVGRLGALLGDVVLALLNLPGLLLEGIGNLLHDLFVPSLSVTLPACEDTFPCNWVAEAGSAAAGLGSGVSGTGSCVAPSVGWADFSAQFPAPAGCSGATSDGASTAGELWGWRVPLRVVLMLGLWLGFFRKIMALAPWAREGDMPLAAAEVTL